MTCSGANRTLPGVVWAEHSLPHRGQGAPLASTVRSTRRCLWRWSCCPGNCSSSVTQGSESNCCRAQPHEQPGDGPPGLYWGHQWDQKGPNASAVPTVLSEDPQGISMASISALPSQCFPKSGLPTCLPLAHAFDSETVLPPAKFKDTHAVAGRGRG